MKKNKDLQNSHLGESCYIVGNGPSLKNMNLSCLHDKDVFSVNYLYKNRELYKTINPQFHVIVDPYFSNLSQREITILLSSIESLCPNISYIVSCDLLKVLLSLGNSRPCSGLYMHDNWSRYGTKKIDLSRNLFGAFNVVHAAIYSAIYMGYKKIYLIGCDMTGLYETLEMNSSKKMINMHAYDVDETEKEQIRNNLLASDNCSMLFEYSRNFKVFKEIREYAENNGISIINATMGGILDVFPRKELEDCLWHEK